MLEEIIKVDIHMVDGNALSLIQACPQTIRKERQVRLSNILAQPLRLLPVLARVRLSGGRHAVGAVVYF